MIKFFTRLSFVIVLFLKFLVISRIILKTINANEQNFIYKWIIEKSEPIVSIFQGLGPSNIDVWIFKIEFNSILALIFLFVIAYILKEMKKIFSD